MLFSWPSNYFINQNFLFFGSKALPYLGCTHHSLKDKKTCPWKQIFGTPCKLAQVDLDWSALGNLALPLQQSLFSKIHLSSLVSIKIHPRKYIINEAQLRIGPFWKAFQIESWHGLSDFANGASSIYLLFKLISNILLSIFIREDIKKKTVK